MSELDVSRAAVTTCSLELSDLLSPDYVANPRLLGPWDSVCLPKNCEPCRNGTAAAEVRRAASALPDEQRCQQAALTVRQCTAV